MSFKGDPSSLSKFSQRLQSLPTVLGQKIAASAAPVITDAARTTFDASQNAYGVPWAPGADGDLVTLEDTGALKRQIQYVAIGTKLRVVLGVKYAKYQIGKRPVYPTQGKELPVSYIRKLSDLTNVAIAEHLAGVSP